MIKPAVTKSILAVLSECNGNAIGEEALFNFTNMKLDAMAVSTAELKEHLVHCKDKGWADYHIDPMSGPDRWFITERGKVVHS